MSFKIELTHTPPMKRKPLLAESPSQGEPGKVSSGLELGDASTLMEGLQDLAASGERSPGVPETWPLSFPSSDGDKGDLSLRSNPPLGRAGTGPTDSGAQASFEPDRQRAESATHPAGNSSPKNVGDVSAPHAAAVLVFCGALGLICAGAIAVLCLIFPQETTCFNGGNENKSGAFRPYNCSRFGHFNESARNETCNTLAPCPDNSVSDNLCCSPNATCRDFNCSLWENSVTKASAVNTRCHDLDGCTDDDNNTCCQLRCTCGSPSCWKPRRPCGPDEYHIANRSAGEEMCNDTNMCTLEADSATCCEPAPTCSGYQCDPPNLWIRANASDILCGQESCTDAECCLEATDCMEWNQTFTCEPDTFLSKSVACINGSADLVLQNEPPPQCSSTTCCVREPTYWPGADRTIEL